jgi:hypothetical protein
MTGEVSVQQGSRCTSLAWIVTSGAIADRGEEIGQWRGAPPARGGAGAAAVGRRAGARSLLGPRRGGAVRTGIGAAPGAAGDRGGRGHFAADGTDALAVARVVQQEGAALPPAEPDRQPGTGS